jgi:CelD/BcsL family acetyltransferase involved in cellulose biosynthesis
MTRVALYNSRHVLSDVLAFEPSQVVGGGAPSDRGTHVSVARTVEEVERLRPAWKAVPWGRVDADLDFYLCVIASRPRIERPHAILVEHDGRATAALAGWIEDIPLESRFGYATVFAPTVRSLTATLGGVVSPMDDSTTTQLVDATLEVFATRDADVIRFPGLPSDSPVAHAIEKRVSHLRRELIVEQRTHHQLTLPKTFDEYLASRSKDTRKKIRSNRNRIERTFGADAALKVLSSPHDFTRIREDIELVAQKTYQRGLGVGFADSREERPLLELSLTRGWFRAYVLYVADAPTAFWTGWAYGDTFYTGATGYDPAFASHRVGNFVLCRLIEDLCGDPSIRFVDFGPGDAAYKHQFGSETWSETNTVIFGPTLRAVGINAGRTAVLAADLGAKRVLRSVGSGDRVKTLWRSRLRESRQQVTPER